MKVLFMGTPDFAATALIALCEQTQHTVCGVVTQPDKPKGRGYQLMPSPVKTAATERGLPVFQPQTLKDGAFLPTLRELNPDLIVVAAYGKILPSYLLDYPKLGCINLHASLLPKYRGAAPIQRSIIDGESETGVTIMKMEQGLDTGDMFSVVRVPITEDDNFETIHDSLAKAGADELIRFLPILESGKAVGVKQDDSASTYAAKIEKADCYLDFSKDAKAVSCQIRGLSPFPLAFCRHNGKLLKITSAKACEKTYQGEVGRVVSLEHDVITVCCKQGSILIDGVLPEGKKRMTAADFIRGRGIHVGDLLEMPI